MQVSVVKTETYNLENSREARALAQHYARIGANVSFQMARVDTGRYLGTLLVDDKEVLNHEGSFSALEVLASLEEQVKALKSGENTSTETSSGSQGSNLVRGKISAADKAKMIEMKLTGSSVEDIAATFNRSVKTVQNIVG